MLRRRNADAAVLVVALLLLFGSTARAQSPCCEIVSINAQNGLVSGREIATGRAFQFSAQIPVLARLKVGQKVWANFATGQVSLDGRRACCRIVSISPAGSV